MEQINVNSVEPIKTTREQVLIDALAKIACFNDQDCSFQDAGVRARAVAHDALIKWSNQNEATT